MELTRRFRQAVAIVSLGALATACAGQGDTQDDASQDIFAQAVEQALESGNLSTGAREILLAIETEEQVTYELYQQAAQLWGECVGVLDFKFQLIETQNEGQTRLAAAMEYPPGVETEDSPRYEALTSAAEQCREENFAPIEWLYLIQPHAVELRATYFEQFRDQTWNCLQEHGSTLDIDTSPEDYRVESHDIAEQTGVDCLYDAGYYDTGQAVDFSTAPNE